MAEGFNAINILFRLTSEDNLTGGFNKAKSAMATLDEQAGKLQMSMTKVNAAMDGMDPAMVSKVTESLDGTDMATQRWNTDLNKVIAKMKEVGATSEQMQTVAGRLTNMREQEDKNVTGLSTMRSGISGIAIAAGAAFTMAGYYLENFVQQCITASTTIQQQNMEIGASMGMNAVQSIQNGPQIENMLNNTEAATGQNVQQLRSITPSVGLVAGGNMQLTQNDLEAISAMTYARQGSGATLSGISGVYNKMVTSGATNPLSQMGISLEDMGMTRTEFQKLSPEERQNVINNAVLGKLGFMNSDVAGTTGAQLQVFQGRLTQFMADLGDSFLPTMNMAMDVLEGIFHIAENIPGLMPIIGALLLAITAITLVLGPMLIMIQLFDADAVATMFGLAADGIAALNKVMLPYLAELTTRITEEGLLPALQWAYATAIDGVSLSSVYATTREWLLAASQAAVGDSGVVAAGGLSALIASITGLLGAIGGALGIPAILGAEGLLATVATEIAFYIYMIGESFMALLTPLETVGVVVGEGALGVGLGTIGAFIAGIATVAGALTQIFGPLLTMNKQQWSQEKSGKYVPQYNPFDNKTTMEAQYGLGDNDPAPRFQRWASKGIQGLIAGLENTAPIKAAAGHVFNVIKDTLMKLPSQAYTWGKNLIGGFVSGIIASIPSLTSILGHIADHFPHSPPKTGPLSTITAMNMQSWMSGIMTAGSSAFDKGLSGIGNIESGIGNISGIAHNYISHGPIQIDASQMSPDELMAMMTYICEKYLLPGENALPTGPTATKSSSTNASNPTPASSGILPQLPNVGGILPSLPPV